MANEAELCAWAIPSLNLKGLPDHTWVTDFDCRKAASKKVADVVAASKHYWYCWGNFHRRCRPKGALGSRVGNLALARCLVLPNEASNGNARAQGTIVRYGVDGVCHQLANQVLYATGDSGAMPVTVESARGYYWSTMRYGTYGIAEAERQFLDRIEACSRRKSHDPRDEPMTTLPDEFEMHARHVLRENDPKLLTDLLALRDKVRATDVGPQPTAASINAQNQRLLDEASKLLGPTKFRAVFGFSPTTQMDLVDPALMGTDKSSRGKVDKARRRVPVRAAAKAKPSKPVTTRQLAAALSEQHELTKKQGLEMMDDLVAMVTKHLRKGERVKIAGLGILQVRKRAARMGRNPATGEAIKIKASKKVAFRPAKDLKEAI